MLLYFSSALGLNPGWAGVAISLSIGWDAITDSLTGHISDNTYSKYGKRIPYIFGGGILNHLLSQILLKGKMIKISSEAKTYCKTILQCLRTNI